MKKKRNTPVLNVSSTEMISYKSKLIFNKKKLNQYQYIKNNNMRKENT